MCRLTRNEEINIWIGVKYDVINFIEEQTGIDEYKKLRIRVLWSEYVEESVDLGGTI